MYNCCVFNMLWPTYTQWLRNPDNDDWLFPLSPASLVNHHCHVSNVTAMLMFYARMVNMRSTRLAQKQHVNYDTKLCRCSEQIQFCALLSFSQESEGKRLNDHYFSMRTQSKLL